MPFDDRFRQVERMSLVLGLNGGGYPNFQEGDLGDEVVYGTIFFQQAAPREWRNVSRDDLGGVLMSDNDAFFRAIDNYSGNIPGAMCGIPTCEQGIENGRVVYGVYFLQPHPSLEWRNVPRSDLGDVDLSDVEGMFRAVDNYCSTQTDLFSGFPSFQQGLVDGVVVYGVYFLRTGYPAEWRDIPRDVFDMLWKYTFNAAITDAQRRRVLERHAFGYGRIRECGNLTTQEKTQLRLAYRKNITHGISTDPHANASGTVGGSTIDINFNNLFPAGDDEIAQTLIHETMHLAGYTHPTRRDPPLPIVDVPGDNGPYYGSPPLRAEICIAGNQSDSARFEVSGHCTCLTPGASVAALPVIDSISFNPRGPDVASEHVLIRNLGGQAANFTGWTLTDTAGHKYNFPAGFILEATDQVRVWTGGGLDERQNLYWGRRQAVWNNEGDTATLRDQANNEISVYSYP